MNNDNNNFNSLNNINPVDPKLNQNNYQNNIVNGMNNNFKNLDFNQIHNPINNGVSKKENNINSDSVEKNGIKVFLIAAIIIIAILIAVIIFLVVNRDNKTVNVYDDMDIQSNTSQTTKTNTDNKEVMPLSDTIVYSGFKFKKNNDYNYKLDSDILTITSISEVYALDYVGVSFNSISLNDVGNIVEKNIGYTPNNVKEDYYNDKKVFTAEISYNGASVIYFIVSAVSVDGCFEGFVSNIDKTINYNLISKVVNMVSDALYIGGSNSFSTQFGSTPSIDSIFQK